MTESIPMKVYEEIRDKYLIPEKISVRVPEDILQIKEISELSIKDTEHFDIITLDASSCMIRSHNITKGLVDHSLIHPREVFRPAISDNALSVICVHNHPSGNPDPSNADIKITDQLIQAGEIIGIKVVDHIIITSNGILSMRTLGYSNF